MSLKFSSSEENYLKTIYHLQVGQEAVTTNALAEKLNTRAASITDMMKKLNAKKLINYKPYYGFSLTAEGKKAAVIIIRRHRLWEYFLSEKLKFNWNEVHEIAEELEHVSNKKLIDKLDEYLHFPSFDPHGDPIPDGKGKIRPSKEIPLAELPVSQSAKVCRVSNQSDELLELLQFKHIRIGSRIEIKKQFDYDRSLQVRIGDKLETLTEALAKNIFVTHEGIQR
jgi:DtxR family transcriptional regulator, Mn-dependent transcriptional regulator